ncbi:MAG: hypothetical protein JO115_21815 [Pseudonocardiales bacterium]|nr:hypothetical protein [Pseudonocardiales bacterium]
MLVIAKVTDRLIAEIVKDTGKLLTISIPSGLLPVHLVVDPPGAARLMRLLAGYAQKVQPSSSVHQDNLNNSGKECDASARKVTPAT